MRKPRALVRGDRVAVVAPASPFTRDEFDGGVAELRRLGFEPVFDEAVFERKWYVAGSAERRAAAIRSAWHDPTIAAVIGVRGGYGSMQVLPFLDADDMRDHVKPFIGYSDLTALLTFFTTTLGLVAFHGPMLAGRLSRGAAGYDEATFMNALCRPSPMGELAPPALETISAGDVSGPLFGGTLTQVVSSLGTPCAFDPPQEYVLLLEEVGERPYRLDRMVTQLRQAGLLAQASAVVIGELPRCDEPSGDLTARAVMADLFEDFQGPVVIGFPTGHTAGPAMTLPLGVRVRVVAPARGQPKLIVEESAVE
jgi:muramoyltetrapeptide carboxypeptidase